MHQPPPGGEPPYRRIAARIRAAITDGELRPGDRVPSTRELMRDHAVAMATATKALNELRKGVFVEGRRTAPADVVLIHAEPKRNSAALRITIHEGRKRQIRLMCDAVGFPIATLRRVRIGPLILKGMRPGECRMLGKKEVDELRRLVGLS